VDLGPTGEDLSNTRYKVICAVLLVHLAAASELTDLECPHMGPAKRVAVLQNRRRMQPGNTRSGERPQVREPSETGADSLAALCMSSWAGASSPAPKFSDATAARQRVRLLGYPSDQAHVRRAGQMEITRQGTATATMIRS
jgi:hypothetical protein